MFAGGSITVVGATRLNEGVYVCGVREGPGRGFFVASTMADVDVVQREFISST